MARLFGTDGVRGLANGAPHRRAGARPLRRGGPRPRRGGRLRGAPAASPSSAGTRGRRGSSWRPPSSPGWPAPGVDVLRAGVLPTPAVAFLTADLGADLGVMLSASHNAMPDNGIKFFARGGHKLADEIEDAIEAPRSASRGTAPTGAGVGRVAPPTTTGATATSPTCSSVLPHRLDGLQVVLDGAHGAASSVAPAAFAQAGAERQRHRREPDGLNINDGYGSTHLDQLQARGRRARRRPRHRPRRRRRPLPGRGRHRRGGRRRPDHGDPGPGHARARRRWPSDTAGRHRDEQPRLAAGHGARGRAVVQTAVGDRYVLEEMKAGAATPRRRAVRPRHLPRPRHDRRRHADRAAAGLAAGRDRPHACATSPR